MKKTFALVSIIIVILAVGYIVYREAPVVTTPVEGPETVPTSTDNISLASSTVYRNDTLHLEARYSAPMVLLDTTSSIATSGYIPVCDPDQTAVCFVYPESALPHRNFSGAGLAIGALTSDTSTSTCLALHNGEQSASGTVWIDSSMFTVYPFGDAAMSHYSVGNNYRAFRDGVCWQVTTRVNTTNFDVYEPGMIDRFTTSDEAVVQSAINNVFESIKFADRAHVDRAY